MTEGNVGRWGKGGYIARTLHSFFTLSTYFGFLFLDVYPRFQHICWPCNSNVHHKSYPTDRILHVSFHTVLKWIGFTSMPPFLQYACIMYYFVFKCVKGEWKRRRKLSAFAALWMRCPLLWHMMLLGWVFSSCLCKTTWLSRYVVAYPTHKWLSVMLQNTVKVKVTPWHASTEEKQSYSPNPLVSRHYTELGGQHHAPAALPPGNSRYPLQVAVPTAPARTSCKQYLKYQTDQNVITRNVRYLSKYVKRTVGARR